MRTLVILLSLLLAGSASALPIFPAPVAGIYESRIQTSVVAVDADGVPTEVPTASVGLAEPDGTVIVCQDAGPDELVVLSYEVLAPASSKRKEANAFAYSQPGCGGERSLPSDNRAYYFFGGPSAPDFLIP